MKYVYEPKGVCSRKFEFEMNDRIIESVKITGGCNGNLTGISRIMAGKDIDEVIQAFEGVHCGPKNTSCPDQIAQALIAYKASLL